MMSCSNVWVLKKLKQFQAKFFFPTLKCYNNKTNLCHKQITILVNKINSSTEKEIHELIIHYFKFWVFLPPTEPLVPRQLPSSQLLNWYLFNDSGPPFKAFRHARHAQPPVGAGLYLFTTDTGSVVTIQNANMGKIFPNSKYGLSKMAKFKMSSSCWK